MRNQVILARPNAFIVKHMKQLIIDAGCVPIKIDRLDEIKIMEERALRAIVISTTVSAAIAESYQDTIKIVRERFQEVPILLATLSDTETVKKIVNQLFDGNLKISSLDDSKNETADIFIIKKEDLKDVNRYERVLRLLKSI